MVWSVWATMWISWCNVGHVEVDHCGLTMGSTNATLRGANSIVLFTIMTQLHRRVHDNMD